MIDNIKNWITKKRFFGWTNLRWLIVELIKMYSANTVSFFSKKRVESGIAFIILQVGMVAYFIIHIGMDMTSMGMWAGIEAVICGYALNKIEKASLPPVIKDKIETDSPAV